MILIPINTIDLQGQSKNEFVVMIIKKNLVAVDDKYENKLRHSQCVVVVVVVVVVADVADVVLIAAAAVVVSDSSGGGSSNGQLSMTFKRVASLLIRHVSFFCIGPFKILSLTKPIRCKANRARKKDEDSTRSGCSKKKEFFTLLSVFFYILTKSNFTLKKFPLVFRSEIIYFKHKDSRELICWAARKFLIINIDQYFKSILK